VGLRQLMVMELTMAVWEASIVDYPFVLQILREQAMILAVAALIAATTSSTAV
jgi:hypothetical protein